MPNSGPIQIRLISGHTSGLRFNASQSHEKEGFKSLLASAATTSPQARASNASTAGNSDEPAEPAPGAESLPLQLCYLPPHALYRTSMDLFPRLSHQDASKLEALAASGQMTWPEIKAALDAKIKLVASDELLRDRQQLERKPQSWYEAEEAWDAYDDWKSTKAFGEMDILSRYSEKASEVYANNPVTETGPSALEHLLARERVVEDLARARDEELSVFAKKLGPQPPRSAKFPTVVAPWNIAFGLTRLTSSESEALEKLNAAGFTGSSNMDTAISGLVGEIAGNIVAWYEREQQASQTPTET